MPRRSLREKRVLLTGASSGIGRELARQLAARGARLLLTARREDRLRDLAEQLKESGAECHLLAGDITDAKHRSRLAEFCRSQWQAADLLVNSAGRGGIGPFDQSDPQRLRTLMEVNFFAPVELTRQLLPLLAAGRQPAVVFVGSVLAQAAVPLKSEYCASKSALRAWCESVELEWRSRGIDVVQAHPSTTRSEFFEHVLGDASAQRSVGEMTPERAAAKVLSAIRRGRRETVFPLAGRALAGLRRWCPPLYRWLLARDAARPGPHEPAPPGGDRPQAASKQEGDLPPPGGAGS